MLTRTFALLFLLLPMLAISGSPMQGSDFPVEIIEQIGNDRVIAFIEESDIAQTSVWEPTQGSPGLSIPEALQAVYGEIAADPKLTSGQLEEIKLEQIPHHAGYWNYLVRMQTSNHEKHTSYYIVLMNGKVVPAVREPGSVK